MAFESTAALYMVSFFTNKDIEEFTPDSNKRAEIMDICRAENSDNIPLVVKVSSKSYAVRSTTTTSALMDFVHVKVISYKNGSISKLNCMANECRKKIGRTKQVR